jgi:alpha-tubulin suppressor-like RCC1 family protein
MDGTVWCWGQILCHSDSLTPVQIPGLSGVAEIRVGAGAHNCALLDDGRVQCWGIGNWGQLGDGQSTPTHTVCPPIGTTVLSGVVSLGVGDEHSCAVRNDGTVHCWGGSGPVLGLEGANAPDICYPYNLSTGYYCASSPVQVPSISGASEISVLFDTNVVRLANGSVMEWGWIWLEQYDYVMGYGWPRLVPAATDAAAVAAGFGHGCLATHGGEVWCWGSNYLGALGQGTAFGGSSESALQVAGLFGITAVGAGNENTSNPPRGYSCAVAGSGGVWCWGDDDRGQLGDGGGFHIEPLPSPVVGLTDVVHLSCGGGHNCAITAQGTVWCWGANHHGQLGDGTTTDAPAPVLVQI